MMNSKRRGQALQNERFPYRSGQSREQYKRIITFFSAVVLLGMLTLLFADCWHSSYADTIQLPYFRRGNWVVIAVYSVIVFLFFRVYGGFRVGYLRQTDALLSQIDVLVDGEFVLEQKNIRLKFRGSENQRVLNLPETLKEDQPVLLKFS
jgi:hypothetical protein